jgi:signal transduction histidine kinase/HAMP domain-containing protein
MNKRKHKSIRLSLSFLVILFLIPFSIIIVYTARQQYVDAYKNAADNAFRMAANLQEQQKFVENNTRQFLMVLSQLPEIQSTDTAKLESLLFALLRQNPSYASLFITNLNGDMIASGTKGKKLNVGDRKYFNEAIINRSFAVGEFTRGRLSGLPVLHYALPVMDIRGRIKSVLVVSLNLNYYDSVFQRTGVGLSAQFAFIDHRGMILYHTRNIPKIGTYDNPEIIQNIIKGEEGHPFVAKGADGVDYLYGFQKLSFDNANPYMYIYVGIPERVAYAQYHQTLFTNITVWFLAFLFIIVASYLYSKRHIIRPIDELSKVAATIAEGNFDVRTGIANSTTEIGRLALAIDEMTEHLLYRQGEHKCHTKELSKLKERYQLGLNSACIGIWDWHIRNNQMVWDKNMLNLYGITDAEFQGNFECWQKYIHKDDFVYFNAEIQNAIEYRQPFRSEFRILHPNLGVKYIRIFASVIDDKQGKPIRLIGVNWDISERKVLERKLHEAKSLAETNDKLKSAFLANISHELRTPLHAIIGFAQILKDSETTKTERNQYLEIVLNSGNKLKNIISNIIDVSVLDSNELQLIEKECRVEEMLRDIYSNFEHIRKIENKGFELEMNIVLEPELVIVTDPYRFTQIFTNLLDNAFKFTASGKVTMGCFVQENELVCFVRDTGPGISSTNIQKIFNRFKTDERSRQSEPNNGLGLAICKGLLDIMNGRIWTLNLPKGIEFRFSLPLITSKSSLSAKKTTSYYS